ncbi:hypothetical protein [Psychrobacillus psychrodurans]|uniref:Uncharacterized protein n=1 Tax=Psychrobacillus psychrodurans TaxID=126157 RepID=A0A9X3L8V7_9BACI|nr:hypothetical protein [Psychrobacillus psychrodurans]MCZ8533542.1 hypothetical protein [Psychrobacillus psychrodurans]
MKNKIIQGLVNFFKDFFKINKEALKTYREQKTLALANGDKSTITNEKLALFIVIFANCILRLVLPLALVILIVVGLTKIFIPLLAIGFLIYICINHLNDEKESSISAMQQLKIQRYEIIADFAFDSFRSLISWLPIKTPQAVRDTFYNPHYIYEAVHELLVFKLLKISPDKVDDEKIEYARKMLASLLEYKLFDEHNKNPHGQYTYKGIPSLFVTRIEDKGDHFLIQIAFIDNDQIYYYLTKQNQTIIQRDLSTSPSDEDF